MSAIYQDPAHPLKVQVYYYCWTQWGSESYPILTICMMSGLGEVYGLFKNRKSQPQIILKHWVAIHGDAGWIAPLSDAGWTAPLSETVELFTQHSHGHSWHNSHQKHLTKGACPHSHMVFTSRTVSSHLQQISIHMQYRGDYFEG